MECRGTLLPHFLEDGFDTLDLLALDLAEKLAEAVAGNGHVGEAFLDADLADVGTLQASLLAEEADELGVNVSIRTDDETGEKTFTFADMN